MLPQRVASYARSAAAAALRTRSARDDGASTVTAAPKPSTSRAIHSSEAYVISASQEPSGSSRTTRIG